MLKAGLFGGTTLYGSDIIIPKLLEASAMAVMLPIYAVVSGIYIFKDKIEKTTAWSKIPKMPIETQKWIDQQNISRHECENLPILQTPDGKSIMGRIAPQHLLYPDYGYADRFIKLVGLAYKEYLRLKDKFEPEVAKIVAEQLKKGTFEISKEIESKIEQIKNEIAAEFNNFINQIPNLELALNIFGRIFKVDKSWLLNTETIVEKTTREFNIYKSICNYSDSPDLKYTTIGMSIENATGHVLYKNKPMELTTAKLEKLTSVYKAPIVEYKSYEIATKPYNSIVVKKPTFVVDKDYRNSIFGRTIKTSRNFTSDEITSLREFLVDYYKESERNFENSIQKLNRDLEVAKSVEQEAKYLLEYPEKSLEMIEPMVQSQAILQKLFDSIFEYKKQKEKEANRAKEIENNRPRIIRHARAIKIAIKTTFRNLKTIFRIATGKQEIPKIEDLNNRCFLTTESILNNHSFLRMIAVRKLLDKNLVAEAAEYINKNWYLIDKDTGIDLKEIIKGSIQELEQESIKIFYNDLNNY
jgi:hypothetical protein